jgi:hypothetical protein
MLQTKGFIEIKNMNAIEFTYLITDKSSDLEAISKLPEVKRQLLISLITEVVVSNGNLDS